MITEHGRTAASSMTIVSLIFVAGLILGGIVTSYVLIREIHELESSVSDLQSQVSKIHGGQNITQQNITIYQNGTSLTEIYERVKDSVVLVRGQTGSGTVQGSGFVFNHTGMMVIITNNHVVHGTNSLSVTFSSGNGYAAAINGTDAYADMAIISAPEAPLSEFEPLEIVSSTTLEVGSPVLAVGNPYGLVGSMTTGVISALGRTIDESEYTGGFAIANIIQTSAPINPGNSGGPLLNLDGKVIGITTAIVADSQGLGFAVPSNTILREIFSLIENGTYGGHPYLGVTGLDMDFETAESMNVNVTYGWKIVSTVSGGPANSAGIQADDIIIGMNGTRIRNGDEMSSYLEENALAGQALDVSVVRGNQTLTLQVTLGRRPPPPT